VKLISVADVRSDMESVLDAAQKERIVVTRAGKPSAVIIGVESYDEEDLRLASSPEFWRLIEERRSGPSIPLAEVKARLEARERPTPSSKGTKGNRKAQKKPGGSKR
jgi:prevent-host-death family protein